MSVSRFAAASPLGLLRGSALLGRLLVLALALSHLGLLWQRIASQTLLEPLALLRWAGSFALVVWVVRRRGQGGLDPRATAVFWLVVVLLHVQLGGMVELGGHEPLVAGGSSLLWFLPVSVPLAAACALVVALFVAMVASWSAGRVSVLDDGASDPGLWLAFPPTAARPPPPALAT